MKVVTYSHARNALKSLLDTVVRDADVAIISRRDAEGDAVVMSLDHYNSLMETLHRLSTPANAEALARAIRQDQEGKARPRTLIDALNRESAVGCGERERTAPLAGAGNDAVRAYSAESDHRFRREKGH